MKKPLVIAFATQKGGTGKSTIGTHIASVLHYLYHYKVAMVDCDYPQYTLQAYRNEEMAQVKQSQVLQDKLEQQGIIPYSVSKSVVSQAVEAIDALAKGDLDFILVDTPGTLNVEGLDKLLCRMDYIFLPMEADKGTIASTLAYMQLLQNFLQSNNEESTLQAVYTFWNKFLKAEKRLIYTRTQEKFEEYGYPILNSRVELLVSIKNERSTFFAMPEGSLAKIGLGQLIAEILTLLGGQGVVTPSGHRINFEPVAWPELQAQPQETAPAVDNTTTSNA